MKAAEREGDSTQEVTKKSVCKASVAFVSGTWMELFEELHI